jgi:hypothetical protein
VAKKAKTARVSKRLLGKRRAKRTAEPKKSRSRKAPASKSRHRGVQSSVVAKSKGQQRDRRAKPRPRSEWRRHAAATTRTQATKTRAQRTGGGAAATGGFNFQHRVTAWAATRVLAEANASVPWDLPEDTVFEAIDCETRNSVDDLTIITNHGRVFCQIKRTVALSRRVDSDLASALAQFVAQFLDRNLDAATGVVRLTSDRDRLVLVCSPLASSRIRENLAAVLARVEGLVDDGALDEIAFTAGERETLRVATHHIQVAWRQRLGRNISDDELRALLALIRIQVLDADLGGAAERESKDLSRGAVVVDARNADSAWSVLLRVAAECAQQRTGADRRRLQSKLLKATIDIQPVRSYRADIERLRHHSRSTLMLLRAESELTVFGTVVKIQRDSTLALRRYGDVQSLLVVGQPGAGKSGALHDHATVVERDGRDFVFLSVGRLDARSQGALRDELGLEHDLLDVLEHWPGRQSAFLIIDALDAARNQWLDQTIRDLISGISHNRRWRVVASIRKFDLRYSTELRRLFKGTSGSEFQDREFSGLRHIEIPTLSPSELADVHDQSPALGAALDVLPTGLREVLFNIRLLAELIDLGVPRDELSAVQTQLQLLDLYWRYRVLPLDGGADAREVALRHVCEVAVTRRELSVPRLDVVTSETSVPIKQLLSRNVLTEWQHESMGAPSREILSFSHHVLFDYAVARLLMRGDAGRLVARLSHDPEVALFARPSVVLHFQYLWAQNVRHDGFWSLAVALIRERGISLIAQLIGPSVSTELAEGSADFDVLVAASEDGNEQDQDAADIAVRHIVGALLVGRSQRPIVGLDAGPWCELAERLSRHLRVSLAYSLRTLLITICDAPERLTDVERNQAGMAARRLAPYARALEPRDGFLIIHALQCVFRTFQSDPEASASVVREGLVPAHVDAFGFQELPRLVGELKHIVSVSPELVASFYEAAFSHRDESEDKTELGGRVLSLTGTRKQDYEGALYQLAEFFPRFLREAPRQAVRALLVAVNDYVRRRHGSSSDDETEEFEFMGQRTAIQTDYSHIWDRSMGSSHDGPIRMLDALDSYLRTLAENEREAESRRALLAIFAEEPQYAVIWSRLLHIGARFPATLGRELSELVMAVPILAHMDTSGHAGEFLKAVFPILDRDSRERIELAILAIADVDDDDGAE